MERLQYISQGNTLLEHENNIYKILDAGGHWVQLRCKNESYANVLALATRIKNKCMNYGAVLIINDSIEIAAAVDAEGVHLGLTDSSIAEARRQLGHAKIIGGTANTYEDVIQRVEEGCDYIGLGPLRHTETKKKLSPILGFEGIKQILHRCNATAVQQVPVFAIGGIQTQDMEELQKIGVYGVAVSSLLTNTPELISELNYKL